MRIILILMCLLLTSCASTSETWTEKRVITDIKGTPILIDGEKQIVDVHIIKQRGIMKAKHSEHVAGESKPWVEMPDYPQRSY